MPFVFFNSVLAHMFTKFHSIAKANSNQGLCYQSCIISFGTTNMLKAEIKSLTLMFIFSQWKVKKSLNLHYPLELALLNDSWTAIPSLQIKKMQYASYFKKRRWCRTRILLDLFPASFDLLYNFRHNAHWRGKTQKKQQICKRKQTEFYNSLKYTVADYVLKHTVSSISCGRDHSYKLKMLKWRTSKVAHR